MKQTKIYDFVDKPKKPAQFTKPIRLKRKRKKQS